MIYVLIGIWAMFGFIAWIYAYRDRQFLQEREFAVIPMYLMGGFLSYICLTYYWLRTRMGRNFYRNPFLHFSLRREDKSLYDE